MPITLAEIELKNIQNIKTDEMQALVKHRVPGLAGDIIQDLGRCPASISFDGIFKGDEALDNIEILRQKFNLREPIAFVSDITDSTEVTDVIIENLRIWEEGGKPNYYAYAISLREFVSISVETAEQELNEKQNEQAEEAQGQQQEQIENNLCTVDVRVELEEGITDYSGISVLVEGTADEGEEISVILNEQIDGIFTAENLPAGTFTATLQSDEE